ncbi:cysteine hydrolase family protein [Streptococcus tangpeifui]|uniref:cysteine hydrolase family protein n=1 Tax=Streptococcus tangpeifui TaxID=2709400 RepID=UPI0013EDC2A7|nr:isochorismatase family cysteine hydrolase [Streptococcus sp. ZJ373]
MDSYLLVIDMQTDYVGKGRYRSNPQLLSAINGKIASYPEDHVIYIVNRFWWELNRKPKVFAQGLSLVSDHIFEKQRASCLSNTALLAFLKERESRKLEIIGVDGNGCVKASALAAARFGFKVTLDVKCIGVTNKTKFTKTKEKLLAAGVSFAN